MFSKDVFRDLKQSPMSWPLGLAQRPCVASHLFGCSPTISTLTEHGNAMPIYLCINGIH